MQSENATPRLLLVMAAIFVGFLVVGIALPVLPLYVNSELGLSTLFVGAVTGAQFLAAIVSRVWAGRHSDKHGPKQAVIIGLVLTSVAGLFYFMSLGFADRPLVSVTILLIGRALLGVGESFLITGGQIWTLAILGSGSTGKAIAWAGSAMFAAFAVGAPIGSVLYSSYGFVAVALATMVIPLAVVIAVLPLQSANSGARRSTGIIRLVGLILWPGIGAALSSVGSGAVIAFSSLLFVQHGWAPWSAFSAFAAAFILNRLLLGHLPDRFSAEKVALICVLAEAAGLFVLSHSDTFPIALFGAGLTGFGYSLVYPALGVRAMRVAPAQDRGVIMGAYTAFLDVALGFGTPALGFVADKTGLAGAFVASAALCVITAGICLLLMRMPAKSDGADTGK